MTDPSSRAIRRGWWGHAGFLILGLLLVGVAVPANAQVYISPSRVVLDSAGEKVVVLQVNNNSDREISYKFELVDYVMTAKGRTQSVDTFDFSAKRMVRFVPQSATVAPNGFQVLRLMARIRPGTKPGAYHTHLRAVPQTGASTSDGTAESQSDGAAINLTFIQSLSIPIVINVGDTEVSIKLAEPARFRPVPETDSAIEVSFGLVRSGNGQEGAILVPSFLDSTGTVIRQADPFIQQVYRERDRIDVAKRFALDPDQMSRVASVRLQMLSDLSHGTVVDEIVATPD